MIVDEKKADEKISEENSSKCNHCREMLVKFVNSDTCIKNLSFVEVTQKDGTVTRTGDVSFTVFMDEMGFSKKSYLKYEKEFFSSFMINFFGEFLVRENVSKFVGLISDVLPQDFINASSSKVHRKFGVTVGGNVVTFIFHVSLLPVILTEDLRRIS